jgi:glycosyltransferase involved in cell wall biosynthesis
MIVHPFAREGLVRPTTAMSNPLRVVHLIPTLQRGGAERQLRQLLPAMAEQGLDVAVFCRLDDSYAEELRSHKITVSAIKCSGNYDPRILFQLGAFAREWKPTVIQTWLPMMDILGGFIGLLLDIPYILSERSDSKNCPTGVRTSLRSFLGRRAAAITVNSSVGADYWRGHPRIRIIPNGIDVDEISHAAPRPESGRRVVVCLARLDDNKNQARLIEAIAIVREQFPTILLRLLGDGPSRSELEGRVAMLGLKSHIDFMGFRDDAWSWLKGAELAALVSHYEGTPNAALEAAAAKCPLILSDIPAHRSAFSANEALFVDKDDSGSIAAGIIRLLMDETLRARLSANAAAGVAGMTISASVTRYLDLYSEVVSGGDSRRNGAQKVL